MTRITWLVCVVIFFLLTKYNLVGLCPCFLYNYMYNLAGRTEVSIKLQLGMVCAVV